MQKCLGKAGPVVSGAHLVPQPLEPLALVSRHLGIDGVEERKGGQQVLAWRALTARVLATGSAWAGDGVVVWQRVQSPEQVAHHRELLRALGKLAAVDESRH